MPLPFVVVLLGGAVGLPFLLAQRARYHRRVYLALRAMGVANVAVLVGLAFVVAVGFRSLDDFSDDPLIAAGISLTLALSAVLEGAAICIAVLTDLRYPR